MRARCGVPQRLSAVCALRIIKNGKLIDIKDIKALDVVSVAKSAYDIEGNYLYTLYVSDIAVSGKISSKDISEKNVKLLYV